MRRVLQHTLFWLCYFAQFAYVSFLWDKATYYKWPVHEVLVVSVTASFFYLLPQMIFPYYMVYYGIDNIVKRKRAFAINVLEVFIVLFLSVLLDRCVDNYIALPYLYHSKRIAPLLEIDRVFIALAYIGFAFGAMLTIKSIRNQLAAKEREKNLIKEKLETELKFLRNQINPHFLLNTLNNIYALTRKKSDDAPEAVMRLSELLRFMLYESNGSLIKLSDELKLLEDYLELETMRYNERLSVSFEKNIDQGNYYITPLLLLPFLENAFKHGISETRFESFIHISVYVADHQLNFEIENSKDDHENKKPDTNIGLVNVKRQLELTYSDYKLNVENCKDIFKVNLFVNLNTHVEV